MLYVSFFKLVLHMVNRQFRACGEVYRPRERAAAVVRARMTPRALRLGHPARPAPTKAPQAIFIAGESRLGAKKCALCADETLKRRVRERKTQVWTQNDEEEESPSIHQKGSALSQWHLAVRVPCVPNS